MTLTQIIDEAEKKMRVDDASRREREEADRREWEAQIRKKMEPSLGILAPHVVYRGYDDGDCDPHAEIGGIRIYPRNDDGGLAPWFQIRLGSSFAERVDAGDLVKNVVEKLVIQRRIKNTKPRNPPLEPLPEPAFPDEQYHGMTLQDYFAAAAITGVARDGLIPGDAAGPETIAENAYRIADAMMELRKA